VCGAGRIVGVVLCVMSVELWCCVQCVLVNHFTILGTLSCFLSFHFKEERKVECWYFCPGKAKKYCVKSPIWTTGFFLHI
jgi:hypothetical protein